MKHMHRLKRFYIPLGLGYLALGVGADLIKAPNAFNINWDSIENSSFWICINGAKVRYLYRFSAQLDGELIACDIV